MNTKHLSLAAVSAALTVVILYLGAILKTGTLAIYYITSLIAMTVVDRAGKKYGILSYLTAVILSWLIVADKTLAASYFTIFGIYPIVKAFAERITNRTVEWIIKAVFLNLALFLCIFLLKTVIGNAITSLPVYILWIGANIFLVLYDILLSFGYTRLRTIFRNV